ADLTLDFLSDVFTELYPEVYNQLRNIAMQKSAASKEQTAGKILIDLGKIVNKNVPAEQRRKELLKALALLGGTGALTGATTYGLLNLLGLTNSNNTPVAADESVSKGIGGLTQIEP
ncbi:MAG: hypothetical protein QXE80_08825, partial [Pyrobaculum sp.]